MTRKTKVPVPVELLVTYEVCPQNQVPNPSTTRLMRLSQEVYEKCIQRCFDVQSPLQTNGLDCKQEELTAAAH